MAPAACDSVTDQLAGVADGTVLLSRSSRRHVETCLRCQADLVQYLRSL